ncbi:MAG TPA: hypothetical protein VH281_04770 [Gaiellaceae bacterium]
MAFVRHPSGAGAHPIPVRAPSRAYELEAEIGRCHYALELRAEVRAGV